MPNENGAVLYHRKAGAAARALGRAHKTLSSMDPLLEALLQRHAY